MALLDATNIELLKVLRDGRKPYSDVARELGVSENTVRARVSRLQEEGVLSFSGLVDVERIDGAQVIYVGVKLESMDHREIAEKLSGLTSVVSTAVVTGFFIGNRNGSFICPKCHNRQKVLIKCFRKD